MIEAILKGITKTSTSLLGSTKYHVRYRICSNRIVNMAASLACFAMDFNGGSTVRNERRINHKSLCTVILDRKRVTYGASSTTEIILFKNLAFACYQMKT